MPEFTTAVVRKSAWITVNSAAPVEGRYGPQYEVRAVVPPSQYEGRYWVGQEGYPDGIKPDSYWAEFLKGERRKDKAGTADWDYNWRLISLHSADPEPPQGAFLTYHYADGTVYGPESAAREAPQPAATATQQGPQPQSPQPSYAATVEERERYKQLSIHRQTALKAAVALSVPEAASGTVIDQVTHWAGVFYDWLNEPFVPQQDAGSLGETISPDEIQSRVSVSVGHDSEPRDDPLNPGTDAPPLSSPDEEHPVQAGWEQETEA
jgi:hypothetical protein